MYDICIGWYTDPTTHEFVSKEKKTPLYSIPITDATNALNDPVVKTEMGKAGSFEFSMYPDHPYYNALSQIKTVMRVVYDGDTIFRGRVLTIDNSPMTGAKKVHLEGDLNFLMDSLQPGVKETETEKDPDTGKWRPKRREMTLEAYLQQVIDEHNRQMDVEGSVYKKIQLGEVPGHYTEATNAEQRVHGDTRKYGTDSWTRTMDALTTVQKEFGGYFRTRYDAVNDICYLDWLKEYFGKMEAGRTIRLKENLIDISKSAEVENIFTVVVPVGSRDGKDLYIKDYAYDPNDQTKKWTRNDIQIPEIIPFVSDNKLNQGYHKKSDYENAIDNFGIIYKPQSFSNADTQEKLWSYTLDWICDNYNGGIDTLTVSALDLHHKDIEKKKLLSGDQTDVAYPAGNSEDLVTRMLTIISVQYNLHNPEKNAYSIGIPNSQLNKTYGKANKSSKNSGDANTQQTEHEKNVLKVQQTADHIWYKYIVNAQHNQEDYLKLKDENPNAAEMMLKATRFALEDVVDNALGTDVRDNRWASMVFDGTKHNIEMYGPVNKEFWEKGDEYRQNFQNFGQSFIMNGVKKELDIQSQMNVVLNPDGSYKYQYPTPLVQMKVNTETNESSVTLWDRMKALLPEEAQASLSLIGDKGGAYMKELAAGLTGEGDQSTFKVNGTDGLLNMFDPDHASDDDPDKTPLAEIATVNGHGISKVGKDTNGDWLVLVNNIVTYDTGRTDKQGNPIMDTQPGFVSLKDIQLPEIDSFKTTFAYIQVLVVDELMATKAIVDELTAFTGWYDGWVRANKGFFNELNGNYISTNVHFIYAGTTPSGAIANVNVDGCYNDFKLSESDGVITLQMLRANFSSETEDTKTFNMAATTFFKNAVAASHDEGGKTAYISGWTTMTLDPQGRGTSSVNVDAYYVDHDGISGRTPENDQSRPVTVTISARALRNRSLQAPVTASAVTRIDGSGDANFVVSVNPTGDYYDGLNDVTITKVNLENYGDVTPSTTDDQQIVPHSGYDGIRSLTVKKASGGGESFGRDTVRITGNSTTGEGVVDDSQLPDWYTNMGKSVLSDGIYRTGYLWLKYSDGKWHRITNLGIPTGGNKAPGDLYAKVGESYTPLSDNTLFWHPSN